jgi:hypothetical protein
MLDICIDHKGLQYIGGSAHGDETIRETLHYHMNSIDGAMPCVNNPLPLKLPMGCAEYSPRRIRPPTHNRNNQ